MLIKSILADSRLKFKCVIIEERDDKKSLSLRFH